MSIHRVLHWILDVICKKQQTGLKLVIAGMGVGRDDCAVKSSLPKRPKEICITAYELPPAD